MHSLGDVLLMMCLRQKKIVHNDIYEMKKSVRSCMQCKELWGMMSIKKQCLPRSFVYLHNTMSTLVATGKTFIFLKG